MYMHGEAITEDCSVTS